MTTEDAGFIEEKTGLFIFLVLLGSCFAWCFLAHCIFIPCCTCLKRRHKLDDMTMIRGPDEPLLILSAHRGGSAEAPENTICAFNKALDQGMNLLEMDVHLSKDG